MLFLLRISRLLCLVVLLLVGVVFILLNRLLELLTQKSTFIFRIATLWYRLLLRVMNVRVTQIGDYQHQGAMICSNHISWLDIPVIGSQLPTYFLSKAELRDLPILGWLAHHAGTLFIQRGGGQIQEVKDLIQAYLSQDHCLTFFPEATTGNGLALRQFHPRLFSAAIESDTPILPVAIEYQHSTQPELLIAFGDESMAQNVWRVLGRWRTDVRLSVLPVLNSTDQERKKLADSAMQAIGDLLDLPSERRGLNFREPLPTEPHKPKSLATQEDTPTR